jgi:hypothetical protein
VAEDRFGDLRRDGAEPQRSAADLLAAGDDAEVAAERKLEQRKAPKPSSAYSWVVGIAFLILIVVVGLNSLPNAGEGIKGPKPGTVIPSFAAPLAAGAVNADVNIKANTKQPGRTLACEVHLASALNGCELRKHPSVIVFAGTRGANCLPGLDRVERVRASFPQVRFAGILIRMGHDQAANTVRDRGWGFPVAYDRDGQLTNIYGIGVCPTTVFARRGGKVVATKLGTLTEAELRAELRRIL